MTEFLKYFDNIPFEFSGFSGLNRINHRIKQYSNIAITTYMKFISCNSTMLNYMKSRNDARYQNYIRCFIQEYHTYKCNAKITPDKQLVTSRCYGGFPKKRNRYVDKDQKKSHQCSWPSSNSDLRINHKAEPWNNDSQGCWNIAIQNIVHHTPFLSIIHSSEIKGQIDNEKL